MGVNSIILLPPDVHLDDATQVIGILAGLPAEKQTLGDSYCCRVPGAVAACSCMPEMATITLTGNLVDGDSEHYTTWHWESERARGERLLMPRASAFWIAIGRRLVDFFGGSICYNDCGDLNPNYVSATPRRLNNPSDGLPWRNFQDEKLRLKPITKAELEEADELASYKLEKAI